VSAGTPALLAAAAGVGFGHAVMPDHWLPLALIGRTRRYPVSRMTRLSGLAGIAHVLMSIVLGGMIVVIGLQFRSQVQSAQDVIVGGLLILTGAGLVIMELSGHGHVHSHDHAHGDTAASSHGHSHSHQAEHPATPGSRGLIAIMVPFGAAASPDLTILPVFLAATTVGAGTAISSLLVFAAVTILTIVGLTLLACFGGYQVRGQWLDRWGTAFTALVLVVIGGLVLAGLI
jgi:nickel/cobalt transporter (NicO) family protein